MIIDKVQPYWTEEDKRKQEEYRQKLDSFISATMESAPELTEENPVQTVTPLPVSYEQWQEYARKMEELREDVIARYIRSFTHNKNGILADVQEIVNGIEREDYLQVIANRVAMLANIKKEQPDLKGKYLDALTAEATESYSSCFDFIQDILAIQLRALVYYGMDAGEVEAIIDRRVRQLGYDNPQPDYLLAPHGTATDAMALMSSRGVAPNPISGKLTIEASGVRLVIDKFNELATSLGINEHKILSVGTARFIAINHPEDGSDRSINYGVTIPFEWYASKCGYDITPHIKAGATEEETRKEEKRVATATKEAKKKIRKSLDALSNSTLSWQERVKGKQGDYDSLHVIGSHGIRNGYIYMVFDPLLSGYLVKLPYTQYPTALLGVDPRNPTAYALGLQMAEHYNMDNNQIRGTACQLKVRTLLKRTKLPDIATVRKTRKSWEERLKEPFEVALESLRKDGVLEDWYYSHPNGIRLTDLEAENIKSYEEWIEKGVHYTLKNAPDHTDRIERARERAQEEERARKPKRKKSTASTAKNK